MITYAVLGYKSLNDKIHPILKKRLDRFIKLYNKGDKVILCGKESYAMSKYIQTVLDISKKDIILENKSEDTIENIKFLLKILKKKKIRNVSLITSSWHMKRVKYIIKYIENHIVNHIVNYILNKGKNAKNAKTKFTFYSSRILNPPNKEEMKQAKKEQSLKLLKNLIEKFN